MDVTDWRNYGVAFSDAESSWSAAIKKEMQSRAFKVVMSHLSFWQKFTFFSRFLSERRRIGGLDRSSLEARGFKNERWIRTQTDYLAVFCALKHLFGAERAVAICKEVMDVSAREPLLVLLPEPEKVRAVPDAFEAFRRYFEPGPDAARRAGAGEISLREQTPSHYGFNVTWCVWLEFARLAGVPEACIPNCYSDDLAFPAYFAAFGIAYQRTGTLAMGAAQCDFCFERMGSSTRGAGPLEEPV